MLQEIPVNLCPGIEKLIDLQGAGRSSKRKAETTLVSPLKKTSRASAGVSSQAVSLVPASDLQAAPSNISALRVASDIPLAEPHHTQAGESENDIVPDNPSQLKDLPCVVWDEGWKMIRQKMDENRALKENMVYPEVFQRKYVKQTVSLYKSRWDQAPEDLRQQFIQYGKTRKGTLGRFTAALKQKVVCAAPPVSSASASHNSHVSEVSVKSEPQPAGIELELPRVINSVPTPAPFPYLGTLPLSESRSPAHADITEAEQEANKVLQRMDAEAAEASIDPTTLCAFCDRPLPAVQSEALCHLRERLHALSKPCPGPNNPLHRSAPISIYMTYCERHMAEQKLMPTALEEGWPLRPNFDTIFDRLAQSCIELRAVSESDTSLFLIGAKTYYKSGANRLQGISKQFESGRFRELGAG